MSAKGGRKTAHLSEWAAFSRAPEPWQAIAAWHPAPARDIAPCTRPQKAGREFSDRNRAAWRATPRRRATRAIAGILSRFQDVPERSPRDRGARGRDRTTDTAIFSRMLYQLSYPGTGSTRPCGLFGSGGYRQGFRSCPEPLLRKFCPVIHPRNGRRRGPRRAPDRPVRDSLRRTSD